MSHIPSPFSPAGLSPRQNSMPDAQSSGFVREQAFSTRHSLDAGLTIQTREGDLVTLNSSSYSQLDAYQYNSRGIVQSDAGSALASRHERQMTLSSGDQFSFTVVGDLNEAELAEIEAIIKDVDQIIEEMSQGDMDDAVAVALGMGGYDTVSSFTADITYERSFAGMVSEQAWAESEAALGEPEKREPGTIPADPAPELGGPEPPIPELEPFPENTRPWQSRGVNNFDQLVEKMSETLEARDETLLDKVREPLDSLFDHHREKADQDRKADNAVRNTDALSVSEAIEKARERIDALIEKIAARVFGNRFGAYLNDQ